MIGLISKLFIKDATDYDSPQVRRAYGVICAATGIVLNVLLFAGKYIAGVLCGSVAIAADAFNNIADSGSSLVTMLGFKLAGHKPDLEHPFGHGRIEYISGLVVAIAIIMMGVELFKNSLDKILHPQPVEFSIVSVIILVCSIAIKLYMFFYNMRIGKKISSGAMKATGMDSLSDCVATFVVLASTLMAHFFHINIDGWCGALVALFVLASGISAVKDTIQPLLGQAPDLELIEEIERIVLSYPGITALHDVIVHDYGPGRLMITLHAEMPINGESNIFEMHDVIDNAERRLKEELGCNATIHLDPVADDDELTNRLKQKTIELINGIDGELSIHDFRVVPGPTHINLIFDMTVPYGFRIPDEKLRHIIDDSVRKMDGGNYYAAVTLEKPFVRRNNLNIK